jgi:putative oxidoreductase
VTVFAERVLATRVGGPLAVVTMVVRVVTGVLFVSFGAGKLVDHASEVHDFEHFGIPIPEVSVYAVGVLEVVGGVLLVLGLLTRVAALVLALNLVGAISTAGRVDGGSFHLGVGPAMLAAMLFLAWAGSGRFALDHRLTHRWAGGG